MLQNGTQKETLTARQRAAIDALLTTPTVQKAAAAAQVSRQTLYRWMMEPTFKAVLAEAEHVALQGTARRLTSLTSKATNLIEQVLENEEASDTLRLRAAFGVLDHALETREAVCIEERIAALETKLGDKQ